MVQMFKDPFDLDLLPSFWCCGLKYLGNLYHMVAAVDARWVKNAKDIKL